MSAGALRVPVEQSTPGAEDERLQCDCGHVFERRNLDVRRTVYISEYDGPLDGFKIEDYTTECNECEFCSDCTLEDGSITPAADREEGEGWFCLGCGRIYEDEEEALDCC